MCIFFLEETHPPAIPRLDAMAVSPDFHVLRLPDQLLAKIGMGDGNESLGALPGAFSFQVDLGELGDHPLNAGTTVGDDPAGSQCRH